MSGSDPGARDRSRHEPTIRPRRCHRGRRGPLGPDGRTGQALRGAGRPAAPGLDARRDRGRAGGGADRGRDRSGTGRHARRVPVAARRGGRRRGRRDPPPGIGPRRVRRARSLRARRPGGRAGSRRSEAAGLGSPGRPGRHGNGPPRRRDPRSADRRDAQADRGRPRRRYGRAGRPGRRPDAPGVRRDLLRAAYRRFPADGPETWTDEASLLEAVGVPVHVVPGDPANLKVTVPDDLARAEAVVAGTGSMRTGIGHDSHPFGPGCSVDARGRRDRGRAPALRPFGRRRRPPRRRRCAPRGRRPGRPRPSVPGRRANAARDRQRRAAAFGARRTSRRPAGGPPRSTSPWWRRRPRLDGYLEAMRSTVAELLHLDVSAVNVKASSGNLDGPEGAGRSISAMAIAMVARIR